MVAIDHQMLEEIVERLPALDPLRVYLFGSRADSRAVKPDSDLDLMLVMAEGAQPTLDIARRARRLIGDVGCGVDVVVRSIALFDRRSSCVSNLEHTVRTRGILLYERSGG